MQRDELAAARNLATLQETLIGTTRELLMTMARLPQVQRRDRDGCNALLAGVRPNALTTESWQPSTLRARCLLSPPAPPVR